MFVSLMKKMQPMYLASNQPGTDVTGGHLNHEGYKDVAAQLVERFKFEKVAITLRGSISASDNTWAAMLYDGKESYF